MGVASKSHNNSVHSVRHKYMAMVSGKCLVVFMISFYNKKATGRVRNKAELNSSTVSRWLAKRVWIIGTSIYDKFVHGEGHLYKQGQVHLFFGTEKEMCSHLGSYPNASCAWLAYSYYSGRIGGTCKSILFVLYLVCRGFVHKLYRHQATA